MVIVPHEDDEINIAGSTICGAREEGMRVICIFVTNGDYKYIPDVRINEAIHALSVLGVSQEDVIFLGYPDGGAHGEYSVFQKGKTEPVRAHGRMRTCGGIDIPEFCMLENGAHSTYRWQSLLKDLETVILKYLPSSIIAVDWDAHPDHRMCSLALDQAMGHILKCSENTYYPKVFKAFAYNTAYEGIRDFYQSNLLSTKINPDKLLHPGQLDNPVFRWGQRVRLPVPKNCREQDLGKNKIFHALTCHMSQKAMRRAEQIINGDQVFWERRTQNLCFRGTIFVSSGNGRYLHDFCLMNTDDIATYETIYRDYLWEPEKTDKQPWCRCEFETPQNIKASVFHGNIEHTGHILRGRLVFSTGYQMDVEFLPETGNEWYVSFPLQKDVQWVQFYVLEREGNHAGLSEWELLQAEKTEVPVLKICVNDNFAYEWMVETGKELQIDAYNPSGKKLRWFMEGKPTALAEIHSYCRMLVQPVQIRVEWENQPDVWDEAIFFPDSMVMQVRKKMVLLKSRIISWWENQKEKRPHHVLRKFQYKL